MKIKYSALILSSFLMFGCKPKLDSKTPEKGNVNAARFVAIGGSVTAGFADGALYYEGQENSLGSMLAEQFQLIGGGNFNQPWMPQSSVGIGFSANSRSVLGYKTDCLGVTSLSPVAYSMTGGDLVALGTNVYSTMGPFHNMGVPGMKLIETVIPNYGTYNPFFARMNKEAASSVIQDAVDINPTFFSIQLGEQDVLSYAMTGATSGSMTPVSGTVGVGFETTLNHVVTQLNVNGARGVIGNIPDITLYPFFNTIPYNGLTLDAANAATLNGIFNPIGITVQAGSNPFLIVDTSTTYGMRQIAKGELILLSIPLDSVKCYKWGSIIPIPDKYVLTADEIVKIKTQIAAYNTAISATADNYGLAVANVDALVKSYKKGTVFNGIGLNTTFVSGGAFSLDGIHLNPIGQAMMANAYIKAINQSFGSTIPQVDATKYRGVKFP